MADIAKAIRTHLLTVSAVTDLLVARVYPDKLPQGATLPAAVLHVISGSDESDLGGLVGVAHSRVQIDAYASTRLAASSLATAIRDALAAQGVTPATWDSVSVSACLSAGGPRTQHRSLSRGDDEDQYITMRDYQISYHG